MIYISNGVMNKLNDINDSNYYAVVDFDKTITTNDSSTTMLVFAKSGLYPYDYVNEMEEDFKHYRKIELDKAISEEDKYNLMQEWAEKSFELMKKYKISREHINQILNMQNMIELREGTVDFINYLYNHNIPLIINSAGCANVIEEILKMNNCYHNNISIYSNFIDFSNNGIMTSIPKKIIHSMNKYDIELTDNLKLQLENKKYVLVVGDQLSDLNMISKLPKKNILSFGFLESNIYDQEEEFRKKFDVVLSDNESFNSINKVLKLGRKTR